MLRVDVGRYFVLKCGLVFGLLGLLGFVSVLTFFFLLQCRLGFAAGAIMQRNPVPKNV